MSSTVIQQVIERHSLFGCFFYWFTMELLHNNSVATLGRQHGVLKDTKWVLRRTKLQFLCSCVSFSTLSLFDFSFNIHKMGPILTPSLLGKILWSEWDDSFEWYLHLSNKYLLRVLYVAVTVKKCWENKKVLAHPSETFVPAGKTST